MPNEKKEDTWFEYQKLVLSELERLDNSHVKINEKLDKMLSLTESVGDIKKWRDEKVDPSLLSLTEFKTQTRTYGTIGQVLIAVIISLLMEKLTGH